MFVGNQPMNGTTFLRIKIDLEGLDVELKKYLELFAILFPKMGSKSQSYTILSEIFAINSSHFEVMIEAFPSTSSLREIKKFLIINIAFLDRCTEIVMNALTELISAPNFSDYTNISQLMSYFIGEKVNEIVEKPLEYALSHSSAYLSPSENWNNKLESLQFLSQNAVNFLKTTDVKKFLVEISQNLEKLYSFCLKKVLKKLNKNFNVIKYI